MSRPEYPGGFVAMKLSGWWHIRNLFSNLWRWRVKPVQQERIPIDELVDNFGAVVNKARIAAGISGRELARRVDVAATTIFRIESGEQPPGAEIMARLLRVLYNGKAPLVLAPKLREQRPRCRDCGEVLCLTAPLVYCPHCHAGLAKNA